MCSFILIALSNAITICYIYCNLIKENGKLNHQLKAKPACHLTLRSSKECFPLNPSTPCLHPPAKEEAH